MKKAEYRTPDIKMVEFKVEVGAGGSITGLAGSTNNTDPWIAAQDPAGDGTEGYQIRSTRGDFF